MKPPSAADRIAAELRDEAPVVDDVSRARMERALLGGLDVGPAATRSTRRRGSRVGWIAGGALAAAAAAVLVVLSFGPSDDGAEVASSPSFTTFQDGETVRRGSLVDGETVETVAAQRVQVTFGPARVDVTPRSRAQFARMLADDGLVRLERGAVEVELHPERRGEQTLAVETPVARVEVVGTVFRVEVDGAGATHVSVTEGTVRVVPHTGQPPRLVHAGQQTRVEPALASIEPPRPIDVAPTIAAGVTDAQEQAPEPRAPVRTPAPDPLPEAAVVDEDADADESLDESLDQELTVLSPESADAPTPLPLDARFALAERYLGSGNHERGRHILYGIARSPVRRADRVRAWTLVAESYARQSNHIEAAEAYRRAANAGRGSLGGHNALFALARLQERRIGDRTAARAAYRRYLSEAPVGPHADLARQALCRLGQVEYCP